MRTPSIRPALFLALIAIAAAPHAGCGGGPATEPEHPPYVGSWFQDGAVRASSAYLHLDPDGTFIFKRVMASRVAGPTHRGQWRYDEASGQLRLFKFLSKGGTAHAPMIAFRYDQPYMLPVDLDTNEPDGRHMVRREVLPDFVMQSPNVSDTELVAQSDPNNR